MFEVKVILDSLAPCGKRLTTIAATFPRIILAEVNTHRDRARNAASSRAIPWPKMMQAITDDPFVPIRFGSEQKGMQTGGEIGTPELAEAIWTKARDNAIASAQQLAELGVHKSICNRLTEPWMWVTQVMSATEWNNFFRLRCHHDAEIHFQKIACMIRDAMAASDPVKRISGEWHLPFVDGNDLNVLRIEGFSGEDLRKISTARCARVSYLTHQGKRDPRLDLDLFDKLVHGSGFGHWSAHEHVAKAFAIKKRSGPFVGWGQYRKSFVNENADG